MRADIKPSNIFVDAAGEARLGDFDVSRSVVTRTALITTRVAPGGMTLPYAAPEVVAGQPCQASDVFSMGVAVCEVHFGQASDQPPADAPDALAGLIVDMAAATAADRPTAFAALSYPYFKDDQPEAVVGRDERRCAICLDDQFWVGTDGPSCRDGAGAHFVCTDCMSAYVEASCPAGMVGAALTHAGHRGELRCVGQACDSYFRLSDLSGYLRPAAVDAFANALRLVAEEDTAVEMEHEFVGRLARERRVWEGEQEIDRTVRLIREDVLTLACPRCRQAFLDFSGCFALTCSRAGCGAGFCAYCLTDCGNDAHAHVANCDLNPGNGVFGDAAQFEEVQRQRRTRLLGERLAAIAADGDGGGGNEVLAVIDGLLVDLVELRIDAPPLYERFGGQ